MAEMPRPESFHQALETIPPVMIEAPVPTRPGRAPFWPGPSGHDSQISRSPGRGAVMDQSGRPPVDPARTRTKVRSGP